MNKILKIQSSEENPQIYFWEYRFWEWNHCFWTLGPQKRQKGKTIDQQKVKTSRCLLGIFLVAGRFCPQFSTNLQVTSFRQRMLRLLPQDQATWMPSKDSLHQKTCWDIFSQDIAETLGVCEDIWNLPKINECFFCLVYPYFFWIEDIVRTKLSPYEPRIMRCSISIVPCAFFGLMIKSHSSMSRCDCLTSIDIISMWYWQRNLWSRQPAASDDFVFIFQGCHGCWANRQLQLETLLQSWWILE